MKALREPVVVIIDDNWNKTVERLRERDLLDEVVGVVRSNHVTMYEACNRAQTKRVVQGRYAAWHLLRGKGFSLQEIASLWGVDRSTVSTALRRAKK